MDILRTRSSWQTRARGLCIAKKLEPLRDGDVRWVELRRPGVSIDSIGYLVVATLIKRAEVEPYFGNVRVDPNCPRIGVEGITILVDLEIEYANGAPEGGVATVTVHRLLVGFISLVVLLTGHVCTAEQIPTLRIAGIWSGSRS